MSDDPLNITQQFELLGRDERELTQLITALGKTAHTPIEQQELGALIREKHRAIHRFIESLKFLAEEQDRDIDRQNYLEQLVTHEKHWKQTQKAIRSALIQSKHALDQKARDERRELFKGATVETVRANELRRRRAAEGNVVLNAANDVTESLRRTTQLMSSELERSIVNTSQLDESSRLVKSSLVQHKSLAGLLQSSQTIITKLEQGDWTDRLIMAFGLIVFTGVVLYVLQHRVWFPFAGILRWLIGQLFGSSAPLATKAVDQVLATVTQEAVTTLATTITTVEEVLAG
ncbi:Vesicle transport protein S20 [Dimargaris cristalligena]|uniref:Sec20-domain-containing protein n=1 Tax=Dimargaris cristalligena TaxID=215637 RepID=A0A4Q0A039_9FUNG|nr:Vesicle transport protein S20 [Dimargaris cristalligena]RKP39436.1 Sec20-domain-containing protein [Dimargaris cristalligena]|eukprot:RKP39436.1 Sec20-domain-containing protein [Dimargaris cristalligena]